MHRAFAAVEVGHLLFTLEETDVASKENVTAARDSPTASSFRDFAFWDIDGGGATDGYRGELTTRGTRQGTVLELRIGGSEESVVGLKTLFAEYVIAVENAWIRE